MLDFLLARPLVLLAGAVLAAGGLAAAHPPLAESLGADVWNVPALREQVREAAAEDERLGAADGDVLQRIAVKEAIVADLIAGRLSLADATDRFEALNADRPEYVRAIRDGYPGATDREKLAHNVIAYALPRAPVADRPALTSRLQTELRLMLSGSAGH